MTKRAGAPGGQYARIPRIPKPREQVTCRLPAELIDYLEREAYIRSARPPYKEVALSEVIRLAIIHFRNTAAATVPGDKKPCSTVVSGDMSFCATCGLRWDTNDVDPPQCPR